MTPRRDEKTQRRARLFDEVAMCGAVRERLIALGLTVIAAVALIASAGCSDPKYMPGVADSTGTIVGHVAEDGIDGTPPWYGSVVYLIPVTPSTEEWWVRLARPRDALVSPDNDHMLSFSDRTTCSASGEFTFPRVRPGDYYIHARVVWTYPIDDSTVVGGGAWIGSATVTARETARVALRPPGALFQISPPVRRFPPRMPRLQADNPDLPRFGQYVYVRELPEAITKVAPDYPPVARRAGIDGTVLVHALVGKDGRVLDTRVTKSIPDLDDAAEAAVRRLVFKPAMTNHKPVAVWIAVPVKFTL